jgi:hypothetical protein
MLIILGLIILVAALIIGADGVLGNGGSAHALAHGFSVLGYHVTGSAGTLFLAGIVVGAAGLLGLSLLLAGARRTARRGTPARRRLQQSRRETAAVSQERDDLINQRDAARAYTASTPQNGAPRSDRKVSPDDGPRSGFHLFGHRSAPRQAATTRPDPVIGQPTPSIPADTSVPDAPASSSVSVPPSAPNSDAPADASAPAE